MGVQYQWKYARYRTTMYRARIAGKGRIKDDVFGVNKEILTTEKYNKFVSCRFQFI